MSEINVVPMCYEHTEGVYDVFIKSLKVKWSLDDIRKELDNRLAVYFVALLDNKVVGFGGMWVIVDEGHITNVAVSPDFRRKSIGKKIFDKIQDYCLSHNIHALTLEVREKNFSAQNFYNSLGFEVAGRRKKYYADTGEDAIIMWKR